MTIGVFVLPAEFGVYVARHQIRCYAGF